MKNGQRIRNEENIMKSLILMIKERLNHSKRRFCMFTRSVCGGNGFE